jgi:hypothetical protein
MADTKKLIERNLTFNHKYIYLSITRGNIMDAKFCTCDNCGKLITNMVKIHCKDTGKYYAIGTDCAETMAKAGCLFNNGMQTDYRCDLYGYNLAARFVTEIKAGCKIEDTNLISCILTNRKGKKITAYTADLKKYFPEYVTL